MGADPGPDSKSEQQTRLFDCCCSHDRWIWAARSTSSGTTIVTLDWSEAWAGSRPRAAPESLKQSQLGETGWAALRLPLPASTAVDQAES